MRVTLEKLAAKGDGRRVPWRRAWRRQGARSELHYKPAVRGIRLCNEIPIRPPDDAELRAKPSWVPSPWHATFRTQVILRTAVKASTRVACQAIVLIWRRPTTGQSGGDRELRCKARGIPTFCTFGTHRPGLHPSARFCSPPVRGRVFRSGTSTSYILRARSFSS